MHAAAVGQKQARHRLSGTTTHSTAHIFSHDGKSTWVSAQVMIWTRASMSRRCGQQRTCMHARTHTDHKQGFPRAMNSKGRSKLQTSGHICPVFRNRWYFIANDATLQTLTSKSHRTRKMKMYDTLWQLNFNYFSDIVQNSNSFSPKEDESYSYCFYIEIIESIDHFAVIFTTHSWFSKDDVQ